MVGLVLNHVVLELADEPALPPCVRLAVVDYAANHRASFADIVDDIGSILAATSGRRVRKYPTLALHPRDLLGRAEELI
jgi:hypothetical protein